MRILFIDNGRKHKVTAYSDFISRLAEINDIILYSPRCTIDNVDQYIKYTLRRFTTKELLDITKPDVILMQMQDHVIHSWRSMVGMNFNKVRNVPTIMIEDDYWLFKDDESQKWYRENIDLIVQRHYHEDKDQPIKNFTWLPWCADERRFYEMPDRHINKENKIVFIGSRSLPLYKIRDRAIGILSDSFEQFTNKKFIWGDDYVETLYDHVGMLACGCDKYRTPPIKLFEGMATKTAVLISQFNGSEELFGNDIYYYQYKDDSSNIVEKADLLLNDVDLRTHVINQAYEIARNKHMLKHRVEEMQTIMETFLDTGEVVKQWGR